MLGLVHVAHLFSGRYARVEGAHVLVSDEAGNLLVVRTTYLRREWMLPGGRVERDEPPHAAAAREAREETGLDVRVTDLLLVDARRRRHVSFVFAAGSPRLDRLLGLIGTPGRARYLGIEPFSEPMFAEPPSDPRSEEDGR